MLAWQRGRALHLPPAFPRHRNTSIPPRTAPGPCGSLAHTIAHNESCMAGLRGREPPCTAGCGLRPAPVCPASRDNRHPLHPHPACICLPLAARTSDPAAPPVWCAGLPAASVALTPEAAPTLSLSSPVFSPRICSYFAKYTIKASTVTKRYCKHRPDRCIALGWAVLGGGGGGTAFSARPGVAHGACLPSSAPPRCIQNRLLGSQRPQPRSARTSTRSAQIDMWPPRSS